MGVAFVFGKTIKIVEILDKDEKPIPTMLKDWEECCSISGGRLLRNVIR